MLHGLGQLASKFRRHPNYYFALAVPASWASRVRAKISFDTMKALHLRIYLVDPSAKVVEVTERNYNATLPGATSRSAQEKAKLKRAA